MSKSSNNVTKASCLRNALPPVMIGFPNLCTPKILKSLRIFSKFTSPLSSPHHLLDGESSRRRSCATMPFGRPTSGGVKAAAFFLFVSHAVALNHAPVVLRRAPRRTAAAPRAAAVSAGDDGPVASNGYVCCLPPPGASALSLRCSEGWRRNTHRTQTAESRFAAPVVRSPPFRDGSPCQKMNDLTRTSSPSALAEFI